MAKRFIDTSIFRKDFIKSLEPCHKLLWLYLINECDHAGLWDVELEVAEIRLGVKFGRDVLDKFGGKIIPVDGGKKWFIPSFIEFQYGQLNAENRAHASVISLLKKFDLLNDDYKIKPLTSPLQGAMDKDMDMDMVKEMDMDKDRAREKNSQEASEVIEYLNRAANRKYSPDNKGFQKLISDRLKSGATVQDCFDVIDFKVMKWKGDPKMDQYLIPSTLFSKSNFGNYMAEVEDARSRGLSASEIKRPRKGNEGLKADVIDLIMRQPKAI